MSYKGIKDHFHFDTEVNTTWSISFVLGLFITMTTIFTFIKILQHLYCIPTSSFGLNVHPNIQPKHVRAYSTLSITFATLCNIFNFAIYPVCAQWSCMDNPLDWMFNIAVWDSSILSKVFLYLIFIGRLFNPYYRRIYRYANYVRYILRILVIAMIFPMIILSVVYILQFMGIYFNLLEWDLLEEAM